MSEVMLAHQRVYEGSTYFNAAMYAPVSATDGARPLATVVIAPGWAGSCRTQEDLAMGMVQSSNNRLAVMTYDDPLVGKGAYSASYRAERFVNVVERVADERPVIAMGHSRGWRTVLDSLGALDGEQQPKALVGLTPLGVVLMPGWKKVLGLVKEVALTPVASGGLSRRGLAAMGHVAARGIAHAVANPRAACQEAAAMWSDDVIARTVAVSRQLPTLMIGGTVDGIVPNTGLRRRLRSYAYPGVNLALSVSHVGALNPARRDPAFGLRVADLLGFTPELDASVLPAR